MKSIKILFSCLLAATFLASCVDDTEKFTGTPVGVMPIETLTGTVTTDTDFALLGQKINFTATLPEGFRNIVTDTVTVEATTITLGGSVRRATVDILPGENSKTGEISIGGGGGAFDLTADLKLTAMNLKSPVPGKHYLLDSNVITIASGNSSVPSERDDRLQIRVSWQNVSSPNNIRVKVQRPSGTESILAAEGSPITSRYFYVANSQQLNSQGNPIGEGNAYAFTPGNYKVKIGVNSANDLPDGPLNLKYRIVVRLPNKEVKVFNGTYTGLTGTSGYIDALQFTKAGLGITATYSGFVNLNP